MLESHSPVGDTSFVLSLSYGLVFCTTKVMKNNEKKRIKTKKLLPLCAI